MNLNIHKIDDVNIAELVSENIEIRNSQNVLDLMANADYLGARKIIIRKHNIIEEFFDLKTKLLGEIAQKIVNYNFQMVIIGDYSEYTKKSFNDFVYESNRTGRILFLSSLNDAFEKLKKQ